MGVRIVHRPGVFLAFGLLAAWLLAGSPAGCTDKTREDSRALRRACAVARRRHAKASALWANPFFLRGEPPKAQAWPLPAGVSLPEPSATDGLSDMALQEWKARKKAWEAYTTGADLKPPRAVDGDLPPEDAPAWQAYWSKVDVRIPAPNAVHPDVPKVLDTAERELREALRACGEADADAQALAHERLGQLAELRGAYHAAETAAAQQTAATELEHLTGAVLRLEELLGWVDIVQRLTNLDDAAIKAQRGTAQRKAQRLGRELDELNQSIQAKENERQRLRSEEGQFRAEAQRLLRQSQEPGREPAAAADLLNEALTRRRAADQKETELRRRSAELEALQAQAQNVAAEKALAEALAAAATEILDRQNAQVAQQLAPRLEALRTALDEPYQAVEASAASALAALNQAHEKRKAARDAYQAAADAYAAAANADPTARDAARAASQAEALVAQARLAADGATVGAMAGDVSKSVRTLAERMDRAAGKLADRADQMAAFAEAADQVRSQAIEAYQKGLKRFKQSVNWAKGERAAAYKAELEELQRGLAALQGQSAPVAPGPDEPARPRPVPAPPS